MPLIVGGSINPIVGGSINPINCGWLYKSFNYFLGFYTH